VSASNGGGRGGHGSVDGSYCDQAAAHTASNAVVATGATALPWASATADAGAAAASGAAADSGPARLNREGSRQSPGVIRTFRCSTRGVFLSGVHLKSLRVDLL